MFDIRSNLTLQLHFGLSRRFTSKRDCHSERGVFQPHAESRLITRNMRFCTRTLREQTALLRITACQVTWLDGLDAVDCHWRADRAFDADADAPARNLDILGVVGAKMRFQIFD